MIVTIQLKDEKAIIRQINQDKNKKFLLNKLRYRASKNPNTPKRNRPNNANMLLIKDCNRLGDKVIYKNNENITIRDLEKELEKTELSTYKRISSVCQILWLMMGLLITLFQFQYKYCFKIL